jgi:hypothetical protein
MTEHMDFVRFDSLLKKMREKIQGKMYSKFFLLKKSFGEWGFFLLRSSRESILVLA